MNDMTLDEARIHALANTPTIRQLYTAAALQGLLSNSSLIIQGGVANSIKKYARMAVVQADAVIEAEKGWNDVV